MPLVINSNAAATMAANNLAASNQLLQRSLNRLSSGSKIVSPADDAGGLAVSMKLAATARRQHAATTNLANSTSFLQSQDGALKVAGKVLDRIGELKTLYGDPTKNASDLANYDAEFSALQAQLTSITAEKFNGIALFGTTPQQVGTTGDPDGAQINMDGVDLLGASSWSNISGLNLASDWTESSVGLMDQSIPPYSYFNNDGSLTSSQTNIGGPFSMSFSFFNGGGSGAVTLSLGGASLNLSAAVGGGFGTYGIQINYDGSQTTYSINGGSAVVTPNLNTPSGGAVNFTFSGYAGGPSAGIANFSLTGTGAGGGGSNLSDVASASDLSAINLSSITDAIQDIATHRANNGAQQSRLAFASELLTINSANLEAASSRITDVDVAEESTQLARYNILVQAGTSMLTQANQSAQNIVRLLS